MADPHETLVEATPRSVSSHPTRRSQARALTTARVPSVAWWRGGLYLLSVGLLYAPYVRHLTGMWLHVPEYAHGPLLPAFTALILWERRKDFRAIAWEPSWWAVPVVGLGVLGFLAARLVGETFTMGMTLILILLGGLLAAGGVPLFRLGWFPVGFLLFGVPLPDGILIALLGNPLRYQAAQWSTAILTWLGYSVLLDGTTLHLPRISLEIAYECSGTRGLLAAVPLAAAIAVLFHRSWKERTLLILLAVPLGLLSNALRVVIIGMRAYGLTEVPTVAQLHGVSGWIPTLVILPMLFAMSGIVRWADRHFHSGSH